MKLPEFFKKRKRLVIILLCTLLALAVVVGTAVLGTDAYVKYSVRDRILCAEEAEALNDADCILVLGCLVRADETPSDMLSDRLTRGVDLYDRGVAPKLLMSGDHGQENYNEVRAMRRFALDAGVPSEDVFMDHAGFSTYESLYRAKEIFGAKRIVIVTQEYHLYRALYIAEALGLDAYGVASDYHTYGGQWMREIREILARNKDFWGVMLKPLPTYLGEPIPLSGDGNITNDEVE